MLEDQPWRSCACGICEQVGIDVAMFRGSERNKRRGFHNLYVFNQRLRREQETSAAGPPRPTDGAVAPRRSAPPRNCAFPLLKSTRGLPERFTASPSTVSNCLSSRRSRGCIATTMLRDRKT